MKNIPGTTNIYKHNDCFEIRKKKNGKDVYLGHATTLIIALMKRDWCKAHNWEKYPSKEPKNITKTPDGKYIVFKCWRKNGQLINDNLGTFNTLKEAERERDLLKKYDWDLEVLCDLNE